MLATSTYLAVYMGPGAGHERGAEPDGPAGQPESSAVLHRDFADSDGGQWEVGVWSCPAVLGLCTTCVERTLISSVFRFKCDESKCRHLRTKHCGPLFSHIQTQEARHNNLSLFRRLKQLLKDDSRVFVFFANEHHCETFPEEIKGESPNDRNDRAIRIATSWWVVGFSYTVLSMIHRQGQIVWLRLHIHVQRFPRKWGVH